LLEGLQMVRDGDRTDHRAVRAVAKAGQRFDVAVVGGGIVGLAAALRLSAAGASVAVIDASSAPSDSAPLDGRTAALLAPAVDLLRRLGAWQGLAVAAPLTAIRIVNLDDRGRTDGDVTFRAGEIGLTTFGYNIPNDALRRALWRSCEKHPKIRVLSNRRLSGLDVRGDRAGLSLDHGASLDARLIVGADGRNSVVRQASRIGVSEHAYGQSALVCSFAHQRAHHGTSIELHRSGGPFTMVPLPGKRSSLVWVEFDDVARHLESLDERGFAAALGERVRPWLGEVSEVSERSRFPLRAMLARRLTGPRVALAGEAAHALSPIGAQGLNLSLRDVEALGDLVEMALASGQDPGSHKLLMDYSAKRTADVRARFHAIDNLNRAVASPLTPLRMVRGLGLRAVGQIPPLRRQVIRAMMDPVTLPGPLARLAG
jgi:2-octaprenyl-6-methoxyphenol hydroxylase